MKSEKEQVEYLKNFVTDEKNDLFSRMIYERTDYATVVLEDLFQSHNQSAVMRSADCFGIQDVHIIENRNRLRCQLYGFAGGEGMAFAASLRGVEEQYPGGYR